jgi:hypothetical protein
MLDRVRTAGVAILFATAGCAYTAPVLTTPIVVKQESAARLWVLVLPAEKERDLAIVTPAIDAIAAELRAAGFQVSFGPGVAAPVMVRVWGRGNRLGALVAANGAPVDRFEAERLTSWSGADANEFAEFGRYVRQRMERSETLRSLAAEQAAKPAAPPDRSVSHGSRQ